ncbi:hypothetical protein Pfo_006080 [Paulownia fortunei]|nr:hypothetical protein Pfo_006080 [Paulownia fortunei]
MKSRLAASVYLFLAGTCRRNTRNTLSSRSLVTSFDHRDCQISSSFHAQGVESTNRAVHSSAIEDEAFSELGPEVSEYCAKQIKLVTEKPDHFAKKTCPSRRELDGRPLSSSTRPRIKEIIATMGGASPTSNSKLGGHSHASTFTDDTKKISVIERPRSVLVKNIFYTVGLSELVEAVSVFGNVSGASFVNASNGLRCCNIEFEDVDSSRRAILAGTIAVGSQIFPVHPLDAVDVVAFRIENINKETTDYTIHSRCKSVGEFVGLARTSKDVVEAFFNVRNDTIHLKILQKLNDTVIDLNRWSAHVLTSKSKSSDVSSDEEARYKLGLQIFDHFSELRRQLAIKKVYLEDLETLNASIMHIEELPPATDLSGSK